MEHEYKKNWALEIPIRGEKWRIEVMHLPDRVKPILGLTRVKHNDTKVIARFDDETGVESWNWFMEAFSALEQERVGLLKQKAYPVFVDVDAENWKASDESQ